MGTFRSEQGNGAAGDAVALFPTLGVLGSAALALAGEQPVLPLRPHGKRPLGGLGLRHATTDTDVVADWWRQWPDANVGMRADGLCILDVDGAAGEQSLHELQRRYGLLPATRVARTSRGRHLVFAAATLVVGNSTRGLGNPAGIDVRGGTRGYVVAPPSVHASGRRYQWIDERPPTPLPDGWREPLTAIVSESQVPVTTEGETAYGRAALVSELERLLRARPGERNHALNLCVFRLAQLVAGGQLGRALVERECLEFALMVGLELHESTPTIRSAMSAGLRSPRAPYARAREIKVVS